MECAKLIYATIQQLWSCLFKLRIKVAENRELSNFFRIDPSLLTFPNSSLFRNVLKWTKISIRINIFSGHLITALLFCSCRKELLFFGRKETLQLIYPNWLFSGLSLKINVSGSTWALQKQFRNIEKDEHHLKAGRILICFVSVDCQMISDYGHNYLFLFPWIGSENSSSAPCLINYRN